MVVARFGRVLSAAHQPSCCRIVRSVQSLSGETLCMRCRLGQLGVPPSNTVIHKVLGSIVRGLHPMPASVLHRRLGASKPSSHPGAAQRFQLLIAPLHLRRASSPLFSEALRSRSNKNQEGGRDHACCT